MAGLHALAAHQEFAQLGQAVAEGLHGGLEHARGARGVVQHGHLVLVHGHGLEAVAGAGEQGLVAFAGGAVQQQQAHVGGLQMRLEGLGARCGGHDDGGIAVGRDIAHFAR